MTASDRLVIWTDKVWHDINSLGGSTAVGDCSEAGCILVTVSISSVVEEQQLKSSRRRMESAAVVEPQW